MNKFVNFIVTIVALGIGSLFAAFFIAAGLHKKEIWEEIFKHISFK